MQISVIVPVYNVQNYLAQCINSIIQQSYTNLEIMLINDGSTDNSPQICEEFRKIDRRIKVINQPNSGVSAARNTGIAIATGDYITFVDSDDWLEKDMYKRIVDAICENQRADIVMCDYITVQNDDTAKITSNLRAGFYSKKDIIHEIYPTLLVTENFGRLPIVSVWNCLFRKTLFADRRLYFSENLRYSEDYLFMAAVMTHCKSYFYIKNYFGYNYRQYEASRSKKYEPKWWINLLDLNKQLRKLLSDNGEYDFTRQLKLQLIHSALFVSGSINNNPRMSFVEKVKVLKTVFHDQSLKNGFTELKFANQSKSLRIVLFIIKQRMPLAYLLYVVSIEKFRKAINLKF